MGPSHFPPLPTSAKKSNGKEGKYLQSLASKVNTVVNVVILVQQWTKEQILAVVTGLTTTEKPEFNAHLSDCPAIRETANTELDINKPVNVE